MIIQNRSKITSAMVKACFHSTELPKPNKGKWAAAITGVAILIFAVIFTLNFNWKKQVLPEAGIQEKTQSAPSVSIEKSEAVSSANPVIAHDTKINQVKGKLLGEVIIARGETVNSLLSSIYGNNVITFREFAEANPGIKNFNRVLAGEALSFPLIRIKPNYSSFNLFWIKYGEFSDLEKAYASLKKFRRDRIAVKLVSFSDSSGNLSFSLLSDKGYGNENAARGFLSSSGIPGSSVIKLDKNNIYYSDLG
jgi:phage tail protein X